MKSRKLCIGFKINFLANTIILLLSCLLNSRAFIFGSMIAMIFLLFKYNILKTNRLNLILLGASLIMALLSLMFLIKIDSSYGRVFIYKISSRMFFDHPISGVGVGQFGVDYGLYQARYFYANNYTKGEFLLADNVYYAFNDYWQLIVEWGITGLIFLFFCFSVLCHLLRGILDEHKNAHINIFLVCVLIVQFAAALFTHVFEKVGFQMATIGIITLLLCKSRYFHLTRKVQFFYSFIAIAVVFSIHYSKRLIHYKEYQRFEEAKILFATGFISEGNQIYRDIYPKLRFDVAFLKEYGRETLNSSNYLEAKKIYEHLVTLHSDYRLYMDLGGIYINLKQFKKAEQCLVTAAFMVPNRFRSKKQLLKFYLDNNDYPKAKVISQMITDMPIKIPSPEIQQIKNENSLLKF